MGLGLVGHAWEDQNQLLVMPPRAGAHRRPGADRPVTQGIGRLPVSHAVL